MPAPPPKPPPRPGAPAGRLAAAKPARASEDAMERAKREKDELEKETLAIEEELEALKAKYDLYFLGVERREPNRWREELKKKVLRLKGAFTRNAGLRFRIQSLNARFLSYERLWLRSAREKEEGTYHRDLFKARLHRRHEEEEETSAAVAASTAPPVGLEPAPTSRTASAAKEAAPPARGPVLPAAKAAAGAATGAPDTRTPVPVAKTPPAPAGPVAPRPAAAASPKATPPAAPPGGGMSEAQMRALYNTYLAAKMTCREDVSKLTYDAVAKTVSKQLPELMTRFKAKTVEFKVEVKDGKAVLKAIPKV